MLCSVESRKLYKVLSKVEVKILCLETLVTLTFQLSYLNNVWDKIYGKSNILIHKKILKIALVGK